jgi:hypothetical protein
VFTGVAWTSATATPVAHVFQALFIALGLLFAALVARRATAAPRGARRMLLPLAAAATFAALEFVVQRIAEPANSSQAQAALN